MKDTVQKLIDLNRDVARAYDKVLGIVDQRLVRDEVSNLRSKLEEFRRDNERHVRELSGLLGKEAPPAEAGDRPFVTEGFQDIGRAKDSGEALKLLSENEKIVYRRLDEAHVSGKLPAEANSLLERHILDELRHLHYVIDAVTSRAWETGAVRQP